MREDRVEMSEDEGESGKEGRWVSDLGGSAKIRGGGGGGGARGERAPSPGGHDDPPPFSDQILENVIEDVLQFLVSRHDRNSASLVCRSWYRAESRTRRELFVGNCYSVAPSRAVERFRSIESLILKGKPRFADFNLVPINWGAHLSPWISAASLSYPFLQKLCLKRMSVSDADLSLLAHSLPFFKDLFVLCCDGFTTAGVAIVAEKCRNLRVLDLIDSYLEDDDEDVVDWISRFPDTTTCLESLSFECVQGPINFDALESLVSRSPALRQLRLNQHVSVVRTAPRWPRMEDLLAAREAAEAVGPARRKAARRKAGRMKLNLTRVI